MMLCVKICFVKDSHKLYDACMDGVFIRDIDMVLCVIFVSIMITKWKMVNTHLESFYTCIYIVARDNIHSGDDEMR